ncbi:MAG: hypothetical protein CFE21_10790 [Bacteroidetes bacterium B1(2017)]|nr:MAG: hypothetical protein CFE21_10790 [Bacteroidetes bacterium B1(2017)]
MKKHKFQQIRITVNSPGESLRLSAQTDKQYARIRGIYVSLPQESLIAGTMLGLKVNNQEIFEDLHEVKLLTSGNQVAPNQKFFVFEEHLDAGGSAIEGRLTDGASIDPLLGDLPVDGYPYEAKIYLWLSNEN